MTRALVTFLTLALLWVNTVYAQAPAMGDVNRTRDATNALLVEDLTTRANAGDVQAQSTLGTLYRMGLYVQKNDAEALKWYRRAAEKGHPAAQHEMGFMYLQGQGIPKDEAEGMAWIRKAAERGHAPAQYALGAAHEHGWPGVEKNTAEAAKWYRSAADAGYQPASKALLKMQSLE